MTVVQHRASLHETSVQAIARGEVSKKRRGRGPQKNAKSTVDTRRWPPLLLSFVRENDIDPLCVEMLSDTSFHIHNEHGPWH